jgi:hypothetical protein
VAQGIRITKETWRRAMTDVQSRVQMLLDQLVERDIECGLQAAAYFNGELIVDAWAGVADPASGRKVEAETLFTVWSCGKGVAATIIHLLVERGLLTYDTPLASVWPEFGTHGKQAITMRHVLTHTAGIPQIPDGISPADLLDWATMCRRVADLEPLWPPGTAMAYHGSSRDTCKIRQQTITCKHDASSSALCLAPISHTLGLEIFSNWATYFLRTISFPRSSRRRACSPAPPARHYLRPAAPLLLRVVPPYL